MTTWLISGSCSGVGKTTVAKQLCAVLPDATYAKLGQGASKPGKAINYFTSRQELDSYLQGEKENFSHFVVEANSYSPVGQRVVRVFLEAAADGNTRQDIQRLRASADIRISARQTAGDWKQVVSRYVKDEPLAAAICGIFAEQLRYLTSEQLAVRSKVWLVNRENELVLGTGLARLLEDIEHLGSLRAAAAKANMSYRHAWGAIKDAEQHLRFKLLLPTTGGSGGGGSRLTAAAKRLLAMYRRLSDSAAAAADREFELSYQGDWGISHD
jgi:molybdate transport system regulatory protein